MATWSRFITSSNSHPSRDWLNFIVTFAARNRVRHWVAEQQRAESIDIGRKLFEKEAVRFQLSPKKLLSDSDGEMKRVASEYGYGRWTICWQQSGMASLSREM
jgi:GTP pyrophosphokinase